MTPGIGLPCLLGGGIAIFAVAVLLRWATMNLGARTGSAWDGSWGIVDILTAWL